MEVSSICICAFIRNFAQISSCDACCLGFSDFPVFPDIPDITDITGYLVIPALAKICFRRAFS